MKVILTGANGFVGRHLLELLESNGLEVIPISLTKGSSTSFSYDAFLNNKICCANVAAFIHLAGAAHRRYTDEEAKHINFTLTKKVVDKCIELRIPRFIFLSSSNIYKEQESAIDLTAKVAGNLPNTAYTKLLAEDYIRSIFESQCTDSVIIRSPLIYGEHVKANFASLMKLVGKGLPLPFRLINKNKRSLVSVYNLVDLIKLCIEHPNAANQVFLVSDDHDLSTANIVELMATVQGKKNLALPVPAWCFKLLGKLLNKSDVIDRLTGSLQLDITHTKATLDWKPPYTAEHGFKLAAKTSTTK